jgi:hypothetical protein
MEAIRPTSASSLFQAFAAASEDSTGEVCLTKMLPDIFRRVQLGAAGRNEYTANLLADAHLVLEPDFNRNLTWN